MSYCRFSSDDFQSDVYVYDNTYGGITIHIANTKVIYKEPIPPNVEISEETMPLCCARIRKISKMVEHADHVPIGLSYDGETIYASSQEECAKILENLRKEGYRIPQYAIDELREEENGI